MMTFKELKKLVKLPLYKEQRVPTVKALEESGVSVVAEKILENHGSISVYQNGYVIYASPRAKLRYVFDIADTHLVQGGKTPILWRIDYSEHQRMILDHLADTYALTQTDSMNAALMELAQQLTAENLEEAMDGLECKARFRTSCQQAVGKGNRTRQG